VSPLFILRDSGWRDLRKIFLMTPFLTRLFESQVKSMNVMQGFSRNMAKAESFKKEK
jgi:DTW domain-containing protein YfiP